MKKNVLKLLAASMLIASHVSYAQDDEETTATPSAPLEISGTVDTYVRRSLNTDNEGAFKAPGTSFADGTGINLGMINVIVSKEGEKSGFVADFFMGPRADAANFNYGAFGGNTTTSSLINQAYVYYKPTDKLTLTIGNFNTFLGYEVISPAVNFNYSTSYMFSYGPFSHTGIKADYAITDELSFMLGAFNQTDYKSNNDVGNANLMFGAQLGYTNDQGGAWLNYVGGNTGVAGATGYTQNQIDITTGWNLTDEFYLGLNATILSVGTGLDSTDTALDPSGFSGVALYSNYMLSENFGIGIRGEYFSDKYAYTGAVPLNADGTMGRVFDFTLSANYKVGNLTFIPEVRIDSYLDAESDKDSPRALLDSDGSAVTSIASFCLAAIFSF